MQTRKYIWYWNPEWYDLYTHGNKVSKLSGCNLIHDILNNNKFTKILDSNYSPILQGCMSIHKGKAKFKNFRILLNSGCRSTIIMVMIMKNLLQKIRSDAMAHASG